ncbi:MAG: spore coat protein U domain-containing protein [Acidobacteria bacterium]|nr:spore coat protein U domain-containing protein [Acidobacteriota bacterium]
MKAKFQLAMGLALLLIATSAGFAYTENDSYQVTARVTGTCTVSNATLDFPHYQYGQIATLTGSTQIEIACSTGEDFVVFLGEGLFYDSHRRMKHTSAEQHLLYELYTDMGMTSIWGDSLVENYVSGTGQGEPQYVTVYGQIPGGQSPTLAGQYQDVVLITVEW